MSDAHRSGRCRLQVCSTRGSARPRAFTWPRARGLACASVPRSLRRRAGRGTLQLWRVRAASAAFVPPPPGEEAARPESSAGGEGALWAAPAGLVPAPLVPAPRPSAAPLHLVPSPRRWDQRGKEKNQRGQPCGALARWSAADRSPTLLGQTPQVHERLSMSVFFQEPQQGPRLTLSRLRVNGAWSLPSRPVRLFPKTDGAKGRSSVTELVHSGPRHPRLEAPARPEPACLHLLGLSADQGSLPSRVGQHQVLCEERPAPAALPELSVPLCAISRSPAAPPWRAPRFQEASSRGAPSPGVCGQGQCVWLPDREDGAAHGWLGQPALLGEKRPASRNPALCTAESRVVDTAARLWSISILPGPLGPQTPSQTTPLAPTHTQAQGHFLEEWRSSSSCFGQVETQEKLSIRGCFFFFLNKVFLQDSLLKDFAPPCSRPVVGA